MQNNGSERVSGWVPPSRPDWVKKINDEGQWMELASVVPLDENTLLDAARKNTGLEDFGEDDWREAFEVLLHSLNEEANLHLLGRLATRAEMVHYLEGRLKIEETYKKHPEINEQEIIKPLYIVGPARSGTSFLHHLLASAPDNNTVSCRDAYFPCEPVNAKDIDEQADQLCTLINRVVPGFEGMYEFGGALGTEQGHLHCLSFRSPWFNSNTQVPSYMGYLLQQPLHYVLEYEKKVLKLLQWRNPRKRWVLKSPYHILHMPEYLDVYPDMKFVWIHRDPIKAHSSIVDLLGSSFWSRSDTPFIGDSFKNYLNVEQNLAMIMQPVQWLERGILSSDNLLNLQFLDLIKEPVASVEKIYDFADALLSPSSRSALESYLKNRQHKKKPVHKYALGSEEQIRKEREIYKPYQDYFQVESEV